MSNWSDYYDTMFNYIGTVKTYLGLMRSLPAWRGLGDLLNHNEFPDRELEQIRGSLVRLIDDVDATIAAVAKHRQMHAEAEARVDALIAGAHK